MYYQLKVKYRKTQENGNSKSVTDTYVTDATIFAEAEIKGFEIAKEYALEEPDVTSIQRLPTLMEVINQPSNDNDSIYIATIVSTFVKDDGTETETKYNVLLYACDINDATNSINAYMKQGLTDLSLVSIKKTKIIGII